MSDFTSTNGPIPGANSARLAELLQRYESRNVTYLADDFPVFWESADGALVTDVDGNQFIDLSSAFGVAGIGHSNPYVAAAIADQAARLMHGMGDVHPTEVRARLLERLTAIVPRGLGKTFLATNGSDAVEAALKTAILATGKPHAAAFRHAYHGLSFGALTVCGIEKFRAPFAAALNASTLFLPYPQEGSDALEPALAHIRAALRARDDIGALIVEPIAGRAGCIVPPNGFLAGLRAICDECRMLLIVDEIYTGFGRTGSWFVCDEQHVTPDILCIGKALGGGFPISAAIGRPEVMDAWPPSHGEALHTSTYLGNPMGCAAALASIEEMQRHDLPSRALALGQAIGARVRGWPGRAPVVAVRGRGAFWAIQLRDADGAAAVVSRALAGGLILLQTGVDGDALAIAPPLTTDQPTLHAALERLEAAIFAGA